MHGNYSTPGLAKAIATGPAFIALNGLGFTLVAENVPVAFYQTTITAADFEKLVLSRTNGKPRLTHIPAIVVDGVEWWYASARNHWTGKLSEALGARYAEDGTASTNPDDVIAANAWDAAKAA